MRPVDQLAIVLCRATSWHGTIDEIDDYCEDCFYQAESLLDEADQVRLAIAALEGRVLA